jgi:hypothetical protein
MSVITISRGTFSGGKLLAERLADELDYRCVDRDVIVEKAAAYGVSQDELRTALEKPPGFLERFSRNRRCNAPANINRIQQRLSVKHGVITYMEEETCLILVAS